MPHFFVPQNNREGKRFHFDPQESRHLTKVLRKKTGDIVQIFDGKGPVHSAKILNTTNAEKVTAVILETQENESKFQVQQPILTLYPALIKGPRFEWMLEKVSELGVSSIRPIITQRTLIQTKADKADQKKIRWEKIILSAVKQSGRTVLPQISTPVPLSNVLNGLNQNESHYILWESEGQNSLTESLLQLKKVSTDPLRISLIIGPEGGFTIEEAQSAQKSGCKPVRLTENILRAETAVIAACSVVLL